MVVPDGSAEVVESSGDAERMVGLDTEYVVAATNVLHEGVTADDHSGGPVGLESAHRSQSGLEPPVVSLNAVVHVLVGVVERVRDQLLDHRFQRLGQVSDHLIRLAMSSQHYAEESASSSEITLTRTAQTTRTQHDGDESSRHPRRRRPLQPMQQSRSRHPQPENLATVVSRGQQCQVDGVLG